MYHKNRVIIKQEVTKVAKKENWEPCPRCKSNRVEPRGILFYIMMGIMLMGVSLILLIIPPIGILGILVGLGFIAYAPFTRGTLYCKECKKSWRPKKEAAAA